MHIKKSTPRQRNSEAVVVVLREAKKLHRDARSESPAQSLTVLRRLLNSDVLRGITLPALYRQREMVQRKHLLQLLASEAGFNGWERYRDALETLGVDQLQHFDIVRRQVGYPNLWFSTPEEAQAHVAEHGGRAMRVGKQAVVLVG